MTEPSIRLRLTAWYSLVLLLGLSLFGFGMWFALRTRLAQRIQGLQSGGLEGETPDRGHVQRELSELASETPDGPLVQLRDPSGAIILPFLDQQPFADRAPVRRTVGRGGKNSVSWRRASN